MGERLLCKQEVDGSIPFTSTTDRTAPPFVSGASVSGASKPSTNRPPTKPSAIRWQLSAGTERSGEVGIASLALPVRAVARPGSIFDRVKRE